MMHASVHHRIENAIAAIDSFLDATEDELLRSDGERIRKLATRIQQAQVARRDNNPTSSDLHLRSLYVRYQQSLEKLRIRLNDLQQALLTQREFSLQQQARITRTRQWHDSFSTTQ